MIQKGEGGVGGQYSGHGAVTTLRIFWLVCFLNPFIQVCLLPLGAAGGILIP